ncbi:MAG TPA: 6,7-dimethyl-8-ribityllumazine synthase [Bryobacteraceae bacterium]|jgi:6,7-dimethyl-8-ribityllumazine synthase
MSERIIEGNLDAKGLRFAIAVARFNNFITSKLLEGALDGLKRHGADLATIPIAHVPGSWELPVAVKALAETKQYDAIIALGAVIRGDTPHFDYVAGHAASGLAQVQADSGIPIAFGVLTTNTVEQAVDRAGAKSGNKGFDAALTAIEMCNLLRQIRASN